MVGQIRFIKTSTFHLANNVKLSDEKSNFLGDSKLANGSVKYFDPIVNVSDRYGKFHFFFKTKIFWFSASTGSKHRICGTSRILDFVSIVEEILYLLDSRGF